MSAPTTTKDKIYTFIVSMPARSVYQLLIENNLDDQYEFISKNVLAGETKTEEYKKINPSGTVPFLVEANGFELKESSAINIYLTNKHNLPQWYPADPKIRARINQYLYFHTAPGGTRSVCMPVILGGIAKDQEAIAKANEKVPALLAETERYLSKTKYIATDDHPTIADTHLFHELSLIVAMKLISLDGYPKTQAWYETILARPATQRIKAELQAAAGFSF